LKTYYKITFLLLGVAFLSVSCSRKKDTFISRNYHALTTKYNILYNGDISLEKGKATINNQYTENFWELLPVERMQITDVIKFGDRDKNPDFQIAEEKAAKAIRNHAMNIKGKEKNPQMDEAYLMLGKARYYDQRFVPALAAFNYIMNKYPTSDKINLVKIWREKANMRLDNNEIVIEKLKRLLEEEGDMKDQYLADASATLAQAYLNINAKDSAMMHLDSALVYTKIKEEKGRYHFIKGQLYNEFGKKDSANLEFDAIIDMHRQIPRAYYINAHLQKSFNFNHDEGDKEAFLEYLTDMEENRENRPFLDKIFYRIAEFHRIEASDSLAESYYNKSLRKITSDNQLKIRNYETLGNMRFDRNEYKSAGAYYDSTLAVMQEKTKPYRVLEKKRRSLDDVIYYEDIARADDSILHLVSLPKEQQLAYFAEITEKLKAEALEEEKRRLEKEKNSAVVTTTNTNNPVTNNSKATSTSQNTAKSSRGTKAGSFYFYNTATVAYGKNEFLRLWGNRRLQDNWRLSSQRRSNNSKISEGETIVDIANDERFDPQTYVDKIPTEAKDIDSIAKERNFAYYQLGGIYKEKFKELQLAKIKFEKLLENNPEERLILPSKYNLYKIYTELGELQNANTVKAEIINDYPDSRYAEILRNPDVLLAKDANDPEVIYKRLYELYDNQEYSTVISQIEDNIKKFEGDPIVPKYEMLKASAKGRLYGFKTYKEGVNFVALNYPNSEEGKKAENLLKESIPILAKDQFTEDDKAKHFNVVYQFENNSGEDIDAFIKLLEEELEKVKYFKLSTSKDVYDENTTFVVVHGLKSINGASGFAELLKTEELDSRGRPIPSKIDKPYFAISSPNYAVVQRHKSLNAYLKAQ